MQWDLDNVLKLSGRRVGKDRKPERKPDVLVKSELWQLTQEWGKKEYFITKKITKKRHNAFLLLCHRGNIIPSFLELCEETDLSSPIVVQRILQKWEKSPKFLPTYLGCYLPIGSITLAAALLSRVGAGGY